MSHEPPANGPDHPPTGSSGPAPAYALLSADGYAVASTDVFSRLVGLPVLGTPAAVRAVAEITSGRSEIIAFPVPLPGGGVADAHAEAVNDAQEKLILLTVAVPRPPDDLSGITAWFTRFVDDSKAVIWLKDPEGRYLHINAQYSGQLEVEPDHIHGRTDAELRLFEAIDGPRNKRVGAPEPVMLEYVIPAFDRRPAYSAIRFPVKDASGATLAVCGVASPADQAKVANAECERLLEVLEWLHTEPTALRRQVLASWGITAVRPQGSPLPEVSPSPAPPTPAAPPVAAGQPPAAPPVAAGQPPAEPSAAPGQATAEPPAAAGQPPAGEPQMPPELAQLLESLQRQVSHLEAKVDSPAPNPQHQAIPDAGLALGQDRHRNGNELQRLEAELAELHAALEAERERAGEAQAARQRLEARMLQMSEQLGAAQGQVTELQAELASARAQIARLEGAPAATAAPAGPLESRAAPVAHRPGMPAADPPAPR